MKKRFFDRWDILNSMPSHEAFHCKLPRVPTYIYLEKDYCYLAWFDVRMDFINHHVAYFATLLLSDALYPLSCLHPPLTRGGGEGECSPLSKILKFSKTTSRFADTSRISIWRLVWDFEGVRLIFSFYGFLWLLTSSKWLLSHVNFLIFKTPKTD